MDNRLFAWDFNRSGFPIVFILNLISVIAFCRYIALNGYLAFFIGLHIFYANSFWNNADRYLCAGFFVFAGLCRF